jgi:DNA-directed RNA polymerase subunit RPC12/RpoP
MTVEIRRMIQERYVIPMVCSRCKHFWGYIGKNDYVVTCPHCRTKLSIKKNSKVPSETGLRVVETLNQSAKVNVGSTNPTREGESQAE